MSEQTINIPAAGLRSPLGGKFRLFVAMCVTLLLSACMPSGEQDINTELFKNKEEMSTRAADLKIGAPKKAVFQALGVAPERFEHMSVHDVQMSIYGNSLVQGSPEELERFKNKLLSYEGYALPYREIKSSSSLGFGKMKVTKTGHDLKLVLIFDRGRLMRASVEGTQEVNQQDDQYLWDTLIKRGIGAAF